MGFGILLSLFARWVQGDFQAVGEMEDSLVDVEPQLDGEFSERRVIQTESSICTSSSHAYEGC